jgi:hypothetical protein
MITRIQLHNFKAHADLDIKDIPHLAVLVGRNNTGKSSVLHAAAISKYGWYQDAPLPIGNPAEVPRKKGEEVLLLVTFRGIPSPFMISVNKGGGYSVQWQGPQPSISPANDIHYLSAQRTAYRQFGYTPFTTDVGMTGEHTWNILHQLKADNDPRFEKIVEWLRKMDLGISSVTTPTVQPGQGAIFPVSYGDRINVIMQGSGTWTLLPIITQGLLAEGGHTILIEEPESHLHRGAINDLWLFLADCAKRDVQVICTTHSLDFLVAMSERIERDQVPKDSAIYHLQRDESGKTSASSLDPSVFRNVAKVIKDDLAPKYP